MQRHQHARRSGDAVRHQTGLEEVTIQLTDRIIISPYAAKRLASLLEGVVKEYEKRFGALNVEGPGAKQ